MQARPKPSPLIISKIIGHRGACHFAPENTLASLRKAQELGASWIEFDAMLTADGTAIVMHDETLDRTTNGHGLVAKTKYAQIAQLDAGDWFAPQFMGEKVPTVLEFLALAEQLRLGVNLEIKPTEQKDIETAASIMQLLQHYGFDQRLKILISSFSLKSLAIARAIDSSLPLGLILNQWFAGWEESLLQLNCVSLGVNYKILTEQKVQEIRNLGCLVLAYTVNDRSVAERLYSWGVNSVFSDNLLMDRFN